MPIPSGSNEGDPEVFNKPCATLLPTRPSDGSDGGNRGGGSPKPPPIRNAPPPPGPKPPPPIIAPPRRRRRGGPTTPDPGGGWDRGLPPGFTFKHGGQFTGPRTGPTPECRCVYTGGPYSHPKMPPIEDRETGCTTSWLFFTYKCEPTSPGPTPPDPVDAWVATARARGDTVSVQRGTTTCKGTEKGCEGECSDTMVTIISCPRGPITPRPLPPPQPWQPPDVIGPFTPPPPFPDTAKPPPPPPKKKDPVFTPGPPFPYTAIPPPPPPPPKKKDPVFTPPPPFPDTAIPPPPPPPPPKKKDPILTPGPRFPDTAIPPPPPTSPPVVTNNDDAWINSFNKLDTPFKSAHIESTVDDSINFAPTNGAYEIFDRGYNLDIESNSTILNLVNAEGLTNGEANIGGLLKDSINLPLSNLLDSKYNSTIPYNGVSVGSILYQGNLLNNYLTTEAENILEDIKRSNLTSLNASTYLAQGLLTAAINGTLENYSLEFLQDIVNQGFISFPQGIPDLSSPLLNRPVAYGMIETRGDSLNPADHINGVASRMIQRSYVIPTDIDLTLKIITLGGGEGGVRFDMARNLEIITTTGTTAKVPDNGHEFLEIITQQNKVTTVTLNSLRNESYQYSIPDLSIMQGLLSPGGEYSVVLDASATNDDILDNVEITGSGQDIPPSMLFELIPSSLTNIESEVSEFRTTQAQYKLTWKTGDSDDAFNSTVSGFSGPRESYYLNPADPIVPYILEADVDGETYLTATYTDIDVQLLDINIPRRINKDFMISFTDQAKYDPFSGGSDLTSFSIGSPLQRTVTMIPSPFAEVQNDSYIKIVNALEDVSNQADTWALSFEKLLDETQKLKDLSIYDTSFTTQQSILGEALTCISSLNVNYDLSTGKGTGKGIPNADFYSLLPFNKVIKFLGEVPGSVINSIFAGDYNGIEVFSVKRNDLEPTFITSSRLKVGASDMEDLQIQKEIPSISYFPGKYSNSLIYGAGGPE